MKRTLYIFLLSIFAVNSQAQSSTVSSGGEGTGPGGSVSFSIGQLVVESTIDSEGSISPGVQQAHESMIVTILEWSEDTNVSLYPNPTASQLHLRFGTSFNGHIYVYSTDGKLISNIPFAGKEKTLDVSQWNAGSYLIQLNQFNQLSSTYQVIIE